MSRLRSRLVAACTLLAVLGALFVSAGTMHPDPANNDFPSGEHLADDPGRYVGDRVTVSGTVVGTKPLTVEAHPRPNAPIRFEITGATTDPAVGDRLSVHGVLRATDLIEAHTTIHDEPWESAYMYVVSFLAGLWVLARIVTHWTFDAGTRAIVPRPDPRSTRIEDTDA